jgi:hypothetical protein
MIVKKRMTKKRSVKRSKMGGGKIKSLFGLKTKNKPVIHTEKDVENVARFMANTSKTTGRLHSTFFNNTGKALAGVAPDIKTQYNLLSSEGRSKAMQRSKEIRNQMKTNLITHLVENRGRIERFNNQGTLKGALQKPYFDIYSKLSPEERKYVVMQAMSNERSRPKPRVSSRPRPGTIGELSDPNLEQQFKNKLNEAKASTDTGGVERFTVGENSYTVSSKSNPRFSSQQLRTAKVISRTGYNSGPRPVVNNNNIFESVN